MGARLFHALRSQTSTRPLHAGVNHTETPNAPLDSCNFSINWTREWHHALPPDVRAEPTAGRASGTNSSTPGSIRAVPLSPSAGIMSPLAALNSIMDDELVEVLYVVRAQCRFAVPLLRSTSIVRTFKVPSRDIIHVSKISSFSCTEDFFKRTLLFSCRLSVYFRQAASLCNR